MTRKAILAILWPTAESVTLRVNSSFNLENAAESVRRGRLLWETPAVGIHANEMSDEV